MPFGLPYFLFGSAARTLPAPNAGGGHTVERPDRSVPRRRLGGRLGWLRRTVAAVLTWSDRPLHDDLDGGPARTRKPPRDEASRTAGTAEADYQESLSRLEALPMVRTQESLSRLSGKPVLTPRDVLEAGGLRRGAPVTARPSANMMIPVAGVSQDRWLGRNLFGFAA